MSKPSPVIDRDLSGRQLGNYRLLRRLGRGAMAEVYLAEQKPLQRNVAFKVLKAELATDATYIKRFHMEARAAASLVHPAIVQIYEVGCFEGIHFIAQEYVQGQNLAERLARQGPPELALAVRVMRQVAAALAKSAEHGIVHRDIKPENLMLSKAGEVKVADFGLARLSQDPENLRLTQIGVTMGSPLYMSPEQVEGRPLDTRSDIYSLGVTCYQMLAGRTPFEGDSALSVAVQHLKNEPERLENLRPDIPPGLCRIVHKMLAKDPANRYANGAELLRELRGLDIEGLGGDWPEDLDQWNTTEMVALTSARNAATQQLAALMKTDDTRTQAVRRAALGFVVVVAFVVGCVLAWPSRVPKLLADAKNAPLSVQRMATAADQYFYAKIVDTDEAWQSVIEYFPRDEQYVRLAQKELADDYLNHDNFAAANQIFDQFSRLGDSEPDYRAYGLAGQFVILSVEGKTRAADQLLQRLLPLRTRLDHFDPVMFRRVSEILQKSRVEASRQDAKEVEDWIKRNLERNTPASGNTTPAEN